MTSSAHDYNKAIIEEFRANSGRVGGEWEGYTIVLIHHIGIKTGIERVTPMPLLTRTRRHDECACSSSRLPSAASSSSASAVRLSSGKAEALAAASPSARGSRAHKAVIRSTASGSCSATRRFTGLTQVVRRQGCPPGRVCRRASGIPEFVGGEVVGKLLQ